MAQRTSALLTDFVSFAVSWLSLPISVQKLELSSAVDSQGNNGLHYAALDSQVWSSILRVV
jgi:hypothetical protein